MKKNILILVAISISAAAYSQVGIDTETPKATLDVVVKSDKLNQPFGIIAPRVEGNQLRNSGGQFNADQDGAIVYATSPVSSGTTGRAKDVTEKGYYYFDASLDNGSTTSTGLWVRMKYEPNAIYQEPWYKVDGKSPATTNTEDIYHLANKVGIGTDNPFSKLHLAGEPTPMLTIRGNGTANTDAHAQGGIRFLESGSTNWGLDMVMISPDNSGTETSSNPVANRLVFKSNNSGSQTDIMTILANGTVHGGRVGIGVNPPTQTLDVNGKTRLRGQIVDNENKEGLSGQVLATNASGQVVWQNNVAIVPAVSAVFPRTPKNMAWNESGATGATLTLPPGKWSVQVSILIDTQVPNSASGWFRTTFSDNPSTINTTSDVVGSRLASGAINGPGQFGMVVGTIIIHNQTNAEKTYHLVKTAYYPFLWGSAQNDWVAKNFGRGIASEDQIVAYPMN